MPTYVYRRPDGTTFEVTQRISADPLTEDPETGEPVERVISGGAGLQFKGSGFYLTDYVKSSGDAKGGSESSGESSGTSGGESSSAKGKTETAAKPTAKAASSASGDG